PMPKPNNLSRSLAALEQDSAVIVVIEVNLSSWFVADVLPGVERHPAKNLEPIEVALLQLLRRCQRCARSWRHVLSRGRANGHRAYSIPAASRVCREVWIECLLGVPTTHPLSLRA